MTFLQLCQAARQECSIQGDGPSSVTDQAGLLKKVVDWVAVADVLIQNLHTDWNFLHATHDVSINAAQEIITKPTGHGMWDIESFFLNYGLANGHALTYKDYDTYRANPGLREQQEPWRLTILPNGNLKLFYPSNDTYQFRGDYWKAAVQMTANADVSLIPTQYHRIIVERAKMLFFEDIESDGQYKVAEKNYKDILADLEDHQLPNRQNWSRHEAVDLVVRPE